MNQECHGTRWIELKVNAAKLSYRTNINGFDQMSTEVYFYSIKPFFHTLGMQLAQKFFEKNYNQKIMHVLLQNLTWPFPP